MTKMSDSNLEKTTIIQKAIASCCGAIITSLFGKAKYQASHREKLYKVITLQFDSAWCLHIYGLLVATNMFNKDGFE